MKGFAHPGYARSFAEFGTPRELPLSGGWLLERSIPGTPYRDAMGCYPLFFCRDWPQLSLDLKALESELVSVALVADPFGRYDIDLLNECFDLVVPFKDAFVADLTKPLNTIVSAHHRQYARKALRKVSVEICEHPIDYLDEWTDLYGALAQRFAIQGMRAFSRNAFAEQLRVPGVIMSRALYEGTAVAAHLQCVSEEVCYAHLAGINSVGHDLMASYAQYLAEIEYFTGKVHWIYWGGSAGAHADSNDGLARFKRGWSTGTKPVYFCGKILNRDRYDEIAREFGIAGTDYFPIYRKGEFL
jgi:hypothetical protein